MESKLKISFGELYVLQREYIKLLTEELNDNIVVLAVHGVKATEDAVENGRDLRAKIKILEDKLGYS